MAELSVNNLRDEYREEAYQKYSGLSDIELDRELRRLERGPGLFAWLRERLNDIINLTKMVVMSIALGRKATAQRLDQNTAEAKKLENEKAVRKEEQIKVLNELLNARADQEQQQARGQDGQQKDGRDPGPKEARQPGQDQVRGPAVQEQQQETQEEAREAGKGPAQDAQAEARQGSEDAHEIGQGPEPAASPQFVFPAVTADVSLMPGYADELKEYLEIKTGISRDQIEIRNTVIGDGPGRAMEVLFQAPPRNLSGNKDSFPQCVRIDQDGNCISLASGKEAGRIEQDIAYAVMAFTSREYTYKDDRNKDPLNLKPGTVPTRTEIKQFLDECRVRVKDDPDKHVEHTLTKFGKEITFLQEEGYRAVYVDDPERKNPIELASCKNPSETVYKAAKEAVKTDQDRLRDISRELHKAAAKEFTGTGYTRSALQTDLSRELAKLLAQKPEHAALDYYGNTIDITNNKKTISFRLNGSELLRMSADIRPKNDQIAERIVNGFSVPNMNDGRIKTYTGLFDELKLQGLARDDSPEQEAQKGNTAERQEAEPEAASGASKDPSIETARENHEEPAQTAPDQRQETAEQAQAIQEEAARQEPVHVHDIQEKTAVQETRSGQEMTAEPEMPDMPINGPEEGYPFYSPEEEYETVYSDNIPVGNEMESLMSGFDRSSLPERGAFPGKALEALDYNDYVPDYSQQPETEEHEK